MKKKFFFFLFGLSFVLANNVFPQAEVSHGASQPLEISISGRGGPVMVNPGEKKFVSFFPKSGNVSVQVTYPVKRGYETLSVPINVYDGKAFIPTPPNMSEREIKAEAKKTDANANISVSEVDQVYTDSNDGYSPAVGSVNQIVNVTTDIPAFHLKIKSTAKSKGDLIFIGEVFTGASLAPTGDTITSREKVRPGLIQITLLYRLPYAPGGSVSGQQFALTQQALAFIVTDPDQVIEITDADFFNFEELAPNTKIRFENVGSPVLVPKTGNKKLKPLRKGQVSPALSLSEVYSTMWYFSDANNVDRIVIFRTITVGRRNRVLIQVAASKKIFNAGK